MNGVVWVLRSGARWSDLPECYGKYEAVHKRSTRWSLAVGWERVFHLLARDRDNRYLMIDRSIVQAHAQAATGQKRGACDQALGRSRGGLTTKWHIAVDTLGRPVRFILTGGNASYARSALPLLSGLDARYVLADKASDGHAVLDLVEATGAQPIIPQRTCMLRERAFDPIKYKLRNRIERTMGRLKQLRRSVTRPDRIPPNYLASLYLAALPFWC